MASPVDICNLALARLGDTATVASIDPPEGSAQAEHCARFYPVARDSLLEMHPWGFATRRAELALLATPAPSAWRFAYAVPTDALMLISVLSPTTRVDDDVRRFAVEGDGRSGALIILTDQENAKLRYIARVTDATRFSALFVDALAWLLASYLAGPVMKGDAGAAMARACLAAFQAALSAARVADAKQRDVKPERLPDWIAAR